MNNLATLDVQRAPTFEDQLINKLGEQFYHLKNACGRKHDPNRASTMRKIMDEMDIIMEDLDDSL